MGTKENAKPQHLIINSGKDKIPLEIAHQKKYRDNSNPVENRC